MFDRLVDRPETSETSGLLDRVFRRPTFASILSTLIDGLRNGFPGEDLTAAHGQADIETIVSALRGAWLDARGQLSLSNFRALLEDRCSEFIAISNDESERVVFKNLYDLLMLVGATRDYDLEEYSVNLVMRKIAFLQMAIDDMEQYSYTRGELQLTDLAKVIEGAEDLKSTFPPAVQTFLFLIGRLLRSLRLIPDRNLEDASVLVIR